MNKKIPIIVDCEPGIDDALALMLAFSNPKKIDVKLITSSVGNLALEKTTRNILFLVETFSPYKVDVAKGEEGKLDGIENKPDAIDVHGKSGLGMFEPSKPSLKAIRKKAIKAMYDTLMQSDEKVVIVALGPMINVSKLLLEHPDCKEKIKCVFAMVGSIDGVGNVTPYAEFNAYHDPVALDIVIKSGVPFVMSPLHLGQKTAVANEKFYSHRRKTFKEDFIYQMIKGSFEPTQEGFFGLHDPQVVYGLLHPELYTFKRCDISVCLKKRKYAQTFVVENPNGSCFVQEAKSYKKVSKRMFKDFYRG